MANITDELQQGIINNPDNGELPPTPTVPEEENEEEPEIVSTETIVSREVAAIPIAEREGVQKFAKDDVFIRNNEIKKTVTKYKKKFNISKFQLPEGDDKEWVLRVQDARRVCRNFRVELEEERESRVKPHNDTVNFFNAVYKPVITELKGIEAPLKALEDQQKQIAKQREAQKELDRKKKVDERVDRLKAAGATWDGAYFFVGNTQLGIDDKQLGMVDIETASDELFETILKEFKLIADRVTEQEEAEKKRKKAEKDKKEEEERLAKQKLIDDQAEVARKQKILDDQEAEQKERVRKFNEKIYNLRRSELVACGYTVGATAMHFTYAEHHLNFDKPLHDYDDDVWETHLSNASKKIEEIKADAAKEKKLIEDRMAELESLGVTVVGSGAFYKNNRIFGILADTFTRKEELWTAGIATIKERIAVIDTPKPTEEAKPAIKEAPEVEKRHYIGSGSANDIPGRRPAQPTEQEQSEAYDAALWSSFKALISATHIPAFKTEKYKNIGLAVSEKIREITSL